MPHLLHLKFKFDPLNNPQRSRHFVNPVFSYDAFPLDGAPRLFIYLVKIYDFQKKLGVITYFCFMFLREKKIRKKTLSVTSYLEKTVYKKPNLGLGG